MSVRLHLPDAATGELTVTGDRFHYLSRVLRLSAGDALEVFDGRGHAWDARVLSAGADNAVLELSAQRESAASRRITVIQGLPKADKLELVLQKCTELGATAFIPAAMKRSVVKLEAERGERKQQRWQKIAGEAARQSGRSDVPRVYAPMKLDDALAEVRDAKLLVLDEEERSRSLAAAAATLQRGEPVALIIGPEGGLDRHEVQALNRAGALSVTLGRRVLRTETAALVALSVLQLLDGELGP